MDLKTIMTSELIAPCGMNCGICYAYLREKTKCPGCRGPDTEKLISCVRCKIKNCEILQKEKLKYCFECENFPCGKVKHLDKRYRTKYGMSMIGNLENIKKEGIRKFIKNEKVKWACSSCGGIICVHKGCCFNCGKKRI